MKNKVTGAKILPVALLFLVGLAFGYFAGKLITSGVPSTNNSLPVLISIFILSIPTFFLAVAFHEAGHALAGIWMNFKFTLFIVGPLMWNKEQSGWKFGWNRNLNTAGGLVMCLPQSAENLGNRFSIYVLAGPVSSLILALVAYGIFDLFTLNPPPHLTLQILAYFFLLLAMMSMILFISTIIPFQTGGFSSDGKRALSLLKGGDAARLEVLIIKITSESSSGIRPRLLNLADLTEAQNLSKTLKSSFGVYLNCYFYQIALDNGDIPLAEQYLLHYIADADSIPDGIRSMVWLDAAFFYSFGKNDLSEALIYWDRFKPATLTSKAEVLATEAAISYLKGEKELTQLKIKESMGELDNMLDKGISIALHDKLLELKIRIEQAGNMIITVSRNEGYLS